MGREIDLTKPLSDEDRAYLAARSRFIDIAKADGLAPSQSREAVEEAVRAAGETKSAPSTSESDDSGSAASGDDSGSEQTPEERYRAMTVPELQAELDKRASEYMESDDDEGLNAVAYKSGDRKDDLVQKLLDDDASLLPEDEDPETA